MMKKLFLAAQLLLGLGLTSCGQEDTPITHQRATTTERISLSVDFASEESNARAMTITSGGSDLEGKRDAWSDYDYMRYRFARKGASKAVFSQEATEPVTLVFYHGGNVYPVESQVKLQNVNGHYRGDIEAELPAALSGVTDRISRSLVCSARQVSMPRRGRSPSQLPLLSSKVKRCRRCRCTSKRLLFVQAPPTCQGCASSS